MTQTLFNGAVVPTNSSPYDLTDDLVRMCQSLNIPIPVDNQDHRNALINLAGGYLEPGTMVLRKDQSMFIEKWDGVTWKTSAHSEWTRSSQVVPANTVWGVGALTIDAGASTDTAFVTHPNSDVLRFRDAGTYSVTFSATGTANMTGRAFVQLSVAGVPIIRTVVTGEDRGAAVIPNFRAAAGSDMVFTAYHESGADRTLSFRIRVTRIA